ncbi:MAG: hypothetical protein AB7O62_19585 [Pirellulales bacterium]
MAKQKKLFIPNKLRPWIEARSKFRLSHAHVQMAREMGLNPHKLGKISNNKQQPWKLPLPQFIEECYFKRFGKRQPDDPRSIEQRIAGQAAKKAAKDQLKQAAGQSQANADESNVTDNAGDEVPF